MIRLLLLKCCLLLTVMAMAKTIVVKNVEELNAANNTAQPGDIIILQDGEWKDAVIKLTCKGTAAKRIVFKSQTPGKLFFTGRSRVAIGGSYITIDGWYFKNGSAVPDDVISFRSSKTQAATYCRVTNCCIDEYHEGKRLDENYWVAFYGNHNRLDHCTFLNKLNMGVLLAVMLEEESWRENYHSIDSNYFALRQPLGSNGGEIIRVGVSQTSMYNSITNIHHNFFQDCDGEAEIISIKSGGNFIRDNVFEQSQGAVVLRHGNNNTVEHNIFFGRGRGHTGGVRIINEGQWVVNNIFVRLRGTGFRSPMAIMNGVPNSPVNRYLAVKDAVIAHNTFINCTALGFGDGSDAERSAAPKNVYFISNIISDPKDSTPIRFFEPMGNNIFKNNKIDKYDQKIQSAIAAKGQKEPLLPAEYKKQVSKRLLYGWPSAIGADKTLQSYSDIIDKTKMHAGCQPTPAMNPFDTIPEKGAKCENFEELKKAVESSIPFIELTGASYHFESSLVLKTVTTIYNKDKKNISFSSAANIPALFIMAASGTLGLSEITVDLSGVRSPDFVLADTTGSVHRFSFIVVECSFQNLRKENGCTAFFRCPKSSYGDMVSVEFSKFSNISSDLFILNSETDNKGLYNAEDVYIVACEFENITGSIIDLYRGGNDESTVGNTLHFTRNKLNHCQSNNGPLLNLTGVQYSTIAENNFVQCKSTQPLIRYKDATRAKHELKENNFQDSGPIEKNQFVTDSDNRVTNP
jgi:poly(beta-D-mannuronate) lyase